MPRGGSRQGTPGRGYANRTDLNGSYDQSKNTAATGGQVAPARPPMDPLANAPGPAITPNQIPSLGDPTERPNEPVTAGLMNGPGPGPMRDQRFAETQQLRRWLPVLELYLDHPETPDSVRALFKYIRGT